VRSEQPESIHQSEHQNQIVMNTITAVQNNGTYEGAYGLMYKQEVTLDDGSTGEVSAKTADKWKVGDVVEVQRTATKFGSRFKFSIPQDGGARPNGSSFKQDPDTQLRIEASWAIGQAVTLLGKDVDMVSIPGHHKLVTTALNLIDARDAVVKGLKTAKEINDKQEKPWEEEAGHVPNRV
jgi:hypothetical protein